MSVSKICDSYGNPITSTNGSLNVSQSTLAPVVFGDTPIPLSLQTSSGVSDSTTNFTTDLAGRQGWFWSNATDPGGKCFVYTFNGYEEDATEGQLQTSYAILSCDVVDHVNDLPILAVYSWPTGSGDAQPWYHSRWRYNPSTTDGYVAGQRILVYFGEDPTDIEPAIPHILLDNALVDGEGLPTEQVFLMSWGSDTGATTGHVRWCVEQAGNVFSNRPQVRTFTYTNDREVDLDYVLGNLSFTDGKLDVNLTSATLATEETLEAVKDTLDTPVAATTVKLASPVTHDEVFGLTSNPSPYADEWYVMGYTSGTSSSHIHIEYSPVDSGDNAYNWMRLEQVNISNDAAYGLKLGFPWRRIRFNSAVDIDACTLYLVSK